MTMWPMATAVCCRPLTLGESHAVLRRRATVLHACALLVVSVVRTTKAAWPAVCTR